MIHVSCTSERCVAANAKKDNGVILGNCLIISILLREAYEENKRQLMELAAAYGELLIREIGGHLSVDEDFRMKRNYMYLQDVPVIGTISLPSDIIRQWEYGGSESFLWTHREYKWKYEEWKRLCHLADIAV